MLERTSTDLKTVVAAFQESQKQGGNASGYKRSMVLWPSGQERQRECGLYLRGGSQAVMTSHLGTQEQRRPIHSQATTGTLVASKPLYK